MKRFTRSPQQHSAPPIGASLNRRTRRSKKGIGGVAFLPCTYSSIEHICAGTGVGERDARCEQTRMRRIFKVPQCVYLAYKFVISAQHPEWKGSTASRRASCSHSAALLKEEDEVALGIFAHSLCAAKRIFQVDAEPI